MRAPDFVFDAQSNLMELPLPETGREQLIGQRTLFVQHLQRKEILERVRHSGLGRVECRSGYEALQRF